MHTIGFSEYNENHDGGGGVRAKINCGPYQPPPPLQVISPPAIPMRPVVAAGAGKPGESASRSDGIAIGLLLGILGIAVFIAMLAHAKLKCECTF
jgi:hypothetical protein